MNHELAKALTTALVQFIDREIPEGTMCCSSAECEKIESSFKLGDFPSIEQFVQKKLSRLTEFESRVKFVMSECSANLHDAEDTKDVKDTAKELLEFAKKELLSYPDESNPAIEAMADLEKAVTCGNVDNISRWLQEELNKAFKKGQELSHEDYSRLLSFIDSLPEEKPSEDLEEAAIDFADNARKQLYSKDYATSSIADYDHGCIDGFKAGAEWQYQKDRGEFAKIKAKTWNEGFDACKEQMMKDAVEGEIGYWNQRGLSIRLDKSLERLGYDMDTKVKIVIVKEDDRPRD